MKTKEMAKIIEEWVIDNWGNRCEYNEKECPLCKAWASYDYLFQFKDEE